MLLSLLIVKGHANYLTAAMVVKHLSTSGLVGGYCKLYDKKIDNYVSCTECMKGGDAECDS